MIKPFVTLFLLFFALCTNAQNTLLNADYWKTSPDKSAVQAEIEKGNNPSEANRNNFDVVTLAINNNAPFESIVFLIAQDGNSISKITHDGRIYLHWAAYKGNAELVSFLIEKGSDVNFKDDKGATPLGFAAGLGLINENVYELFFKAGVDPKVKYQNGASLVHLTVGYDTDLKLLDYLTTKGLSLYDVDDFGNTTFDYSARLGNIDLMKKLLSRKVVYNDKALLFASQGTRSTTNTLSTYQYLVGELKLNPNALGDNGENVLHNLVKKRGQEGVVSYFISQGTDVNVQDKNGNSILMNASSGSLELVDIIMPKVKNVNVANAKGETAVAIAIKDGKPEVVSFLLKNGASVHAIDKEGNNLVYYWMQSYQTGFSKENRWKEFNEKADLLTQSGLDLSTPQRNGNTLYHLAVTNNDVELLKYINDFGVDINAINQEGMTALHKAALTAQDDLILKYLVSNGARTDVLTEFDETAYDLAKENESLREKGIALEFLQ